MLLKIYAHCIDGQADAANERITDASMPGTPGPGWARARRRVCRVHRVEQVGELPLLGGVEVTQGGPRGYVRDETRVQFTAAFGEDEHAGAAVGGMRLPLH